MSGHVLHATLTTLAALVGTLAVAGFLSGDPGTGLALAMVVVAGYGPSAVHDGRTPRPRPVRPRPWTPARQPTKLLTLVRCRGRRRRARGRRHNAVGRLAPAGR